MMAGATAAGMVEAMVGVEGVEGTAVALVWRQSIQWRRGEAMVAKRHRGLLAAAARAKRQRGKEAVTARAAGAAAVVAVVAVVASV